MSREDGTASNRCLDAPANARGGQVTQTESVECCAIENNSMNRPLLKSLVLICGLLLAALGGFIGSRDPGRAQVRTRSVARSDSGAQSGNRTWGSVGNPGN